MFLSVEHFASQFPACFLISNTSTVSPRHVSQYRIQRQSIPCMFLNIARSDGPLQTCIAPKYTISGRRRFCNARNTLFLAAADLHGLEIHYFWSPQVLQRPKYTISGRCRFCNARNTLFLVAADLHGLEIHYFRPPVSPRNGKAATRHGVGAVAFQRKW